MDPLRLSEADREAAVDQLGEHYAVGRITKDEFDERSDAIWSAKTRGDLAPIFADLPVRSPALPAPTSRGPFPRSLRWTFPLVPVLFVLIAITVVTHLPFVLFGLLAWFVLSRRCGATSQSWGGHRSRMR